MKKIKNFWMILIFLPFLLTMKISAGDLSVVGGLTRQYTLSPGSREEAEILLRNGSTTSRMVRVNQADYLFQADGKNFYPDPGTTPRSCASWITISSPLLELPPESSKTLEILIEVPPDQRLRGTYWSLLMLEPFQPEDKVRRPQPGLTLRTRVRYAIQLMVHIGDTGTRKIKILDRKIEYGKEGRILNIDVKNSGDRVLSPTLWAELFDIDGNSSGRLQGGKWRIYPECSVRYLIDLASIPAGRYRALVVLDNGDEFVFGARYQVRLLGPDDEIRN